MFRSLKSSLTLSSTKSPGKPTLTLLGGSERTLGNRKRTVPRTMPSMDTVRVVQAMAMALPNIAKRKKRRSLPVLAGVFGGAGLAGGAGFGGWAVAGAAIGGGPAAILVSSGMVAYALQITKARPDGPTHAERFSPQQTD